MRWYIDCGDDDFLYEGNSLIHIAMRKRQIGHQFRIRDGGLAGSGLFSLSGFSLSGRGQDRARSRREHAHLAA
ncbi:hypothetical protein OAS39_02305 [Pirellulales bacterium]|nr:hypothetical protein [Pirellulales bacterium]